MRIVMSPRTARLPSLLALCLAVIALALFSRTGRGEIASSTDDSTLLAETFDQAQDVMPSSATTRPSSGPFLPAPSSARKESGGNLSRSDAGEIVPLEEYQHGPLSFSVTGLYMYGGMTGYAQTPHGPNPASTTPNRPKFNSIGIDTENIADLEFDVSYQNHQIFLGGQYNHISGNQVLARSVVSGGVTFPTHSTVHSDVRFDWYRLGYRYNFNLDTAPNGVPDFTLTPWLDVFYWDYGFSMDAGSIGHAGKSLQKLGLQLGGTLAWRPNGGPLSIEASLGSFPQSSRLPTISTESVLARYHFYHWRHMDFNALLGVAFEQQIFDDRRRGGGNNRIVANFGPMLLTGLQINF